MASAGPHHGLRRLSQVGAPAITPLLSSDHQQWRAAGKSVVLEADDSMVLRGPEWVQSLGVRDWAWGARACTVRDAAAVERI